MGRGEGGLHDEIHRVDAGDAQSRNASSRGDGRFGVEVMACPETSGHRKSVGEKGLGLS